MTEQHGRDPGEAGRSWRPIARFALIAGGLLILTSALFPRPADPSDSTEYLRLLVDEEELSRLVLLLVPIGIWAFALGIAAVVRVLRPRRDDAARQVASYTLLVGSAVVLVQFGLGNAALAEAVSSDIQSGATLWAGATHVRSFGMLIIWTGLVILGFGLLREARVHRLLSWPPLLLGASMIAVTIPAIIEGPRKATAVASGVIAALTAIWAMFLGAQMGRFQSSAGAP